MEVFISNLDSKLTKDQLKHILTPTLAKVQISVFDIRKRNDKTFAQLTIVDTAKAQKLLAFAAQSPTLLRSPSGKHATFVTSRHAPNPQLLKVLQKEEKDLVARRTQHKSARRQPDPKSNTETATGLALASIEFGRWETVTGRTEYVPYFYTDSHASVTAQTRALVIRIDTSSTKRHDLVIEHNNILSASLSRVNGKRTATITMDLAPKIFEDERSDTMDALAGLFMDFDMGSNSKAVQRYRVHNVPGSKSAVIGTCLNYRLTFREEVPQFARQIQKMTFHSISLTRTAPTFAQTPTIDYTRQIAALSAALDQRKCSFSWRFQIQALWVNGLLSPREILLLLPEMDKIRRRSGESALVKVVERLSLQLAIPDATTDARSGGVNGALKAMQQQEKYMIHEDDQQISSRDEVSVHRVTVTPTGIYLSGPEEVAANRILRQYREHGDCFLRVLFSDENEEKIQFDRDFSNERILEGRFLTILRKGLDVAGQHFDFLGFSHSSLRTQTCWFMRGFVHQGSLLFAGRLRAQIGDFSQIRCPAKCAARIGQAFSESTSAVKVDPSTVQVVKDVKAGEYIYTDGCGTMSRSIWRLLRGSSSSKDQATSYQIRYKGAKGMLTLDTRLNGSVIQLRESMVKFTGSPSNEIEICGTNIRPLPFKMNRPMIKILEDLDVPASAFENLQEQAIQNLRMSARSPTSAIDFIRLHMSDNSSGISTLLRCLQKIRIDVTEDTFLREMLGALLQVQLREIKYRSRILVPSARTLYGISDESGWLREGQVFVIYTPEDSKQNHYHTGHVAVTRSPALHPGDIQMVQAMVPPEGSWARSLHNCVIFSQHGWRDLPSMLSGGDLDGDLYNVIFDRNLLPRKTTQPAASTPAKAIDVGRTVTADDITEFFIDFMKNDQVGRIATLHQVFADISSTYSTECLELAELHSTAVDFSKSGVPVDVKKIPKVPPYRPDFMASTASTKVEKGIKRPAAELAEPEGDQRYRYYESDRVLGKLYRAVDEDIFFQDLEDDDSSMFSRDPTDTVLGDILEWVKDHISPLDFMPYMDLAEEARDWYEAKLQELMAQYAVHRSDRLTEKEVFIGTILGKSGNGSKYQREKSQQLKSQFNLGCQEIRSWMEWKAAEYDSGSLYLAAACLAHAVEEESNVDKNLGSFGWIAAAMCVPQLLEQSGDE